MLIDRSSRARLYATALGLYDFHINGQPVGDHVLTPDWTDYNRRVRYQAYDVTTLVRSGDNAIAGCSPTAGTRGISGTEDFSTGGRRRA